MPNKSKLQESTFKGVNTSSLQRGLVAAMGEFANRRQTVAFSDFVKEFHGRSFNGKRADHRQLRRHVSWMKSHGVLKVVAKAMAAKGGR